MFIRKKKNKSGSISIQVISKAGGQYKVLKSFGASRDWGQIQLLKAEAQAYIDNPEDQARLFPIAMKSEEESLIDGFVESLRNTNIQTIGPELIFGTIFDRLGFNAIPEDLFRHITIARLAYPTSKLKTVDYLHRYKGMTISISSLYRFLDRLNKNYKKTIERISFEHSKKILKTISVVFYHMTTLYFEAEDEDDLRKIGFSKDGKFNKPQIMLGLLVGENGYPIGYDIFEGNTFEGKTLIPTLEKIRKQYGFERPIVIADAGLLSRDNLDKLGKQNYKFIIAARIKNESKLIKKQILRQSKAMKHGDSFVINKAKGIRLIVTYSDKRAKKDAYNRRKGLRRLEKRVATGKLTKQHINNRGYNKFLELSGELRVEISKDKVKYDEAWDGLKGYITNTNLSAKKVVQSYGQLWQIEKAFRISKTDLRIRPMYHYKRRRIEAHICIAFVAYSIWKELERLLDSANISMTPKRAAELSRNMYALEYLAPGNKSIKKKILKMDDEQKLLYELIHS